MITAEEMLEEFKDSAQHADRNSRLTELENSFKFLEAKFVKIEKVLKDIPSYYVMPVNNKKALNKLECGQCRTLESQIESLKGKLIQQKTHYENRLESSVNIKKAHFDNMELIDKEHSFLLKRIVAIYGNKGLVDIMSHHENPNLSPERLGQYMKIKPHF